MKDMHSSGLAGSTMSLTFRGGCAWTLLLNYAHHPLRLDIGPEYRTTGLISKEPPKSPGLPMEFWRPSVTGTAMTLPEFERLKL